MIPHESLGTIVALLAEGVDRNNDENGEFVNDNVALLAEGVDRNYNKLIL